MNCEKCAEQRDYGMNPYVVNVEQCTIQNRNYRRAVWTGCYLQMTVMSISACEETGPEFHKDMDQYIRVEQGNAIVRLADAESVWICRRACAAEMQCLYHQETGTISLILARCR